MIKITSLFFLIVCSQICYAQCPTMNGAMINACGVSEGVNEFTIFTTATTANASTYIVNYGIANPPVSNRMDGTDATTKTGTGVISATGGCTINFVTSPSTSIPSGSKVVFIPAETDNNYDLTSICNGGTMYVVYINTVAPPTIVGTTSWPSGGTLGNNASTPRYLQVTSSTAGCNGAGAPVVSYNGNSFASNIDGNFVTWNSGVPSYGNNGCSSIALPVSSIDVKAVASKSSNTISWVTGTEINIEKYRIEKSNDGFNFLTIGNVQATGSNSTYTFLDNALDKKMVYYRIVIIDNNGSTSISNIVSLKNNFINKDMLCYPTLTNSKVAIEWVSSNNSNTTISITNSLGQMVVNKQLNCTIGHNKTEIDINKLNNGQYFIILENSESKMVEKFWKIN